MTSAGTPIPTSGMPVTFNTVIKIRDEFTTPERIQEYAQASLDAAFGTRAPGLRPTVAVSLKPTGEWVVTVSVTGEGYGHPVTETRLYPTRLLLDAYQVKSAAWLQYADALSKLGQDIKLDTEAGD